MFTIEGGNIGSSDRSRRLKFLKLNQATTRVSIDCVACVKYVVLHFLEAVISSSSPCVECVVLHFCVLGVIVTDVTAGSLV
jgi:hypothetical protein